MSARPKPVGRVPSHGAAPTGRKKLAQGKEHGGRPQGHALGHESQNKSSPDGAKEGWITTTLGKFCGNRGQGVEPAKTPEKHFELYSVPSFPDGKPEIVRGKEVGSNKQLVEPQGVLLCRINPRINRAWVVGNFTEHIKIASTEWIIFPPSEEVVPDFLCYFLQHNAVRDFLAHNASGVGGSLMRVKPSTLRDFPFEYPKPKGQRRIVAEIEKQFTRIEAGVAAMRRVQANLKRYRASVLKAACEGPWPTKTLKDCFKVLRGRFGHRPRNEPRFYNGRFPFVQIGDLPRNGGSITKHTHTLNEAGLAISRLFPAGTVLIAIVGATIGNTGILGFDSCAPDSLVALESCDSTLCKFAEHYLQYKKFAIRSTSYASGGQPNINLGFLRSYPLPLPPPAEQTRIVAEVERRLSVVEELEAVVSVNLQRAARLRQSILQKAFSGELLSSIDAGLVRARTR